MSNYTVAFPFSSFFIPEKDLHALEVKSKLLAEIKLRLVAEIHVADPATKIVNRLYSVNRLSYLLRTAQVVIFGV